MEAQEALFWSLVALGVTWILTDYLNSRFAYVSDIANWLAGHGFAHGLQRYVCHTEEQHGRRMPIQNSASQFWFRISVLVGMFLLAVASVISSLAELLEALAELIEVIGRLIAPQ